MSLEIDKLSLSPSLISQLRQCPRRWYYEATGIGGVVVEDKHLVYGRAIHNILDMYFDSITSRPSDLQIRLAVEEAFDRGFVPIMKLYGRTNKKVKENFIRFEMERARKWRQYKPDFTERKFAVRLWDDLPEFHGIIDFYCSGDATVIDWKTGDFEMGEDAMLQGKIYELTLKRLGYPVERVLFVDLVHDRRLVMPQVTAGWVYQLAKWSYDLIKSNRFPKKPSLLCTYCPYNVRCSFDSVGLWMRI